MTTGRINQVSCVRLEELADGVFSSAVYPSQQTFKIFFFKSIFNRDYARLTTDRISPSV